MTDQPKRHAPLGPRFGFGSRWGVRRSVALAAALLAVLCQANTGPAAAAPAQAITIWMAGDSTMANSAGSGIVGWGREFGSYFDNVTVVNSAVGGRSVQTWLYEGAVSTTKNADGECALTSTAYSTRWQAMLNGMKSGDYLVVQFGINDGDSACPRHVGTARYQALLTMMAQAAQARGARPILVTPLAAITCSGSTAVGNRGFLTQTKAAGTAAGAPVIDLHALSLSLYNSLKLCPNNGDYTQGAVGTFFADDHTHLSASGANQIAGVVAKAVSNQGLPLAAWLKTAATTTTTTTTTTRPVTTTTTTRPVTTTTTTRPVTTTTTTRPVTTTTTTRPVTTTTTTTTTTTRPATTTTTTAATTTTTPVTTTTAAPTGGTGCAAAYRQVGAWPGGFQGEVTVTNTAATSTTGWTVVLTWPSGQTVSQLWSGAFSTTGATTVVTNAAWNGAVAASASTTFGFIGSGTAATPSLTCTRA